MKHELAIAAMNVMGHRGKHHEIRALRKQTQVLGLCETWHTAEDAPFLSEADETIEVQRTGKGRPMGGVAMYIHPLLKYKLIDKIATRRYQYITIQVTDTFITMAYISPAASEAEVEKVLEGVDRRRKGKAILMGDLNARNRKWDKITNRRGTKILEWARSRGWEIRGAGGPTCHSNGGASSPDLFMIKGVRLRNARIHIGPWSGCSDHEAIKAEAEVSPEERKAYRYIPRGRRKDEKYIKKAKQMLKVELPQYIDTVKRCTTWQELEQEMGKVTRTLLAPWEEARTSKPSRYRRVWNRELDTLAKDRSRLYRCAKRSGKTEDWERHEELHKKIKRKVRAERMKQRALVEKMAEEGTEGEHLERAITIARQLVGKGKRTKLNDIRPQDFTKRMSTNESEGHIPDREKFEVTEDFIYLIEKAIRRAPTGKAEGSDEVFTESLNIYPVLSSRVLAAVYQKCSDLDYTPSSWRTATLVPLFKKGEKTDVRNYRPIALLSHTRKTIEAAIAMEIRGSYEFDDMQLGFQPETGTETAIVRHVANGVHLKMSAVLDLKGAYDSVPRDRMMEACRKKLPRNVVAKISHTLQPDTIITKGDDTGFEGKVTRGVPQGSPLSPTLFNVYMDTLAERIKTKMKGRRRIDGRCTWDATLFADDVKMQAADRDTMQELLNIATEWASDSGMTWAPHKCDIVTTQERESEERRLTLAGAEVKEGKEARYLGVTISARGVTENGTVERVKASTKLATLLTTQGVNTHRMSSCSLAKVAKTVVVSKALYGIHVTPMTKRVREEWEKMELALSKLIFGWGSVCKLNTSRVLAKTARLSHVVAVCVSSLEQRIRRRANKQKNNHRAGEDVRGIRITRHKLKNRENMTREQVEEARRVAAMNRTRRIPVPRTGYAPMMMRRNARLTRLGSRWYAGTFPPNIGGVKRHVEGHVREAVKKIEEAMEKEAWKDDEKRQLEEAMAVVEAASVRWSYERKE